MAHGRDAVEERTWTTLAAEELPVAETLSWVVEPASGAVVTFFGTVRDHEQGRPGVTSLEYEAYEVGASRAMSAIADEVRQRWETLGRVALHHRVGLLAPCDVAVLVAVAAPHRNEAFEAARWCIDTLKATVPIWKYETWDGGSAWSTCTAPLESGRWDGSRAEAAGVRSKDARP